MDVSFFLFNEEISLPSELLASICQKIRGKAANLLERDTAVGPPGLRGSAELRGCRFNKCRRTHSAHSVPCVALNKCPGRIGPASHL